MLWPHFLTHATVQRPVKAEHRTLAKASDIAPKFLQRNELFPSEIKSRSLGFKLVCKKKTQRSCKMLMGTVLPIIGDRFVVF